MNDEVVFWAKMEESRDTTDGISQKAAEARARLLPTKSRDIYQKWFDKFKERCTTNKAQELVNKQILLASLKG
jgi:hypothetical protein